MFYRKSCGTLLITRRMNHFKRECLSQAQRTNWIKNMMIMKYTINKLTKLLVQLKLHFLQSRRQHWFSVILYYITEDKIQSTAHFSVLADENQSFPWSFAAFDPCESRKLNCTLTSSYSVWLTQMRYNKGSQFVFSVLFNSPSSSPSLSLLSSLSSSTSSSSSSSSSSSLWDIGDLPQVHFKI